ncbi:3-isopropylmalate dehydratase small subunit [Salipiger sp. P9]|uniref:3-isopropylmalate dehydratase small subunit n=1 Tax=Salipiger pentaromativorans TaxID=2943193 RepID=UPI0021573D39|nr:3-isopropylmalate dehydratase small subunit [Salipiger pentaromativorans]MCR8551107.1 3-isopropylmalate dehydratase small subunit [Salipiger pentaromativorans]
MEPFTVLDAAAAPLDMSNVDTGLIIPARFTRKPRRSGYQDYLFHDLRFRKDGSEAPGFVLNREGFRDARILVADRNFGAGSSREQAVWSLLDYGIRCVIAADFGEILEANALKCGLLPVRLDAESCLHLRGLLHAEPGARIRVDLAAQRVTGPDGVAYGFDIPPFRKTCLLGGLDDIDITRQHDAAFLAFETAYRQRYDWLFDAE